MWVVGLIVGCLLLAAGLWIIHRASDADEASGGFGLTFIGAVIVAFTLLVLFVSMTRVQARDLGQWDNQDPAIKQWYESLMQPDVPTASCCGEADAYWCDDVHVRDNRTFCKITDDRADEPRMRPHVEIGTEYEIPPNKLKWDRANPTGHFIIFLSRGGYVYCFVQGGGV